jgi:hypothetical protein
MHTSSSASSFVAHPEMAGEPDDEELITPDALIKQKHMCMQTVEVNASEAMLSRSSRSYHDSS